MQSDMNEPSIHLKPQCRGEEVISCLNRLYSNGLHESILRNLRKLSFSSMTPRDRNELTQHHFNRNGRLVANKQLIYSIDQDDGLQSVRGRQDMMRWKGV